MSDDGCLWVLEAALLRATCDAIQAAPRLILAGKYGGVLAAADGGGAGEGEAVGRQGEKERVADECDEGV